MITLTCKVYDVKKDGLYDKNDESLNGRVAFIFDGCIVSGWYLDEEDENDGLLWEANDDVGRSNTFGGIEKYIIFDVPIWNL
jgi:hypothetical protein